MTPRTYRVSAWKRRGECYGQHTISGAWLAMVASVPFWFAGSSCRRDIGGPEQYLLDTI